MTGRPWGRTDRLVLAALVVLPAVLFLVPLAFGHVMLPGDDLTQNYPLRVLSGRDVRHGLLPLWDPFEWSGTPLLGGFNAGSIYPATLVFSFLPASLAWGLGQAATYALAGTGMLLFLRRRGLATVAAGLGALVFTWSGFMAAQLSHTGLVEGMSWAPWILLALDHLALDHPAAGGRRRLAWVGFLGLAGGLVSLGGDPRAVSDVAIVVVLYAGWLVWRCPRAERPAVAGWILVGAVVAGLVSAGQLLPGLALQAGSQRSGTSYDSFVAGSLAPPLLLLEAFPFVLGGFASVRLPPYTGDYNLPEVSGYLGLLALAGALVVAFSWRRRSDDAPSGAGIWVLMAAGGIVLALGRYTPLARLLVHVPLYGGQRLQSRNLGVVDLAGAVLFAMWVDRFVTRGWRGARRAQVAGLVAPAAVAALVVTGLAWPGGLEHWLRSYSAVFPRVWPFAAAALVLAAGVALVLLRGHGWAPRARARAVVALTVVDVGFFFVNAAYGWEPTAALGAHEPGAAALAAALPAGSRFAVYDPGLQYPGWVSASPQLLPVTDVNALPGVPSAQGYGSIVQADYADATGTHTQGSFDPGILSDRRADQLNLSLVLVGPTGVGLLDDRLVPPRWVPAGTIDGMPAWRNTDALSPAVVEVLGGSAGSAAQSVDPPVSVGGPAADGSATFHVVAAAPEMLVRSASWAPGWRATLIPAGPGGKRTRTEAVKESGFLQAADVPPGDWMVRFGYHPARAYDGILLTVVGAAAGLVLVGVGLSASRSRSRPGPRLPGAGQTLG